LKRPETEEEFLQSFHENRHNLTDHIASILQSVIPRLDADDFENKWKAGRTQYGGEWKLTGLYPAPDIKGELLDLPLYIWWLMLLMHFDLKMKNPTAADVSSLIS
jgi:hypothetical protein